MLSVLVQPVLKCMQFLHAISTFTLNTSLYIGRIIILILLYACNIVRDILIVLSVLGEELYGFICEVNAIIGEISSSANGSINSGLEAVGVFIKHIGNFFVKSRLYSKLLSTHIGSFLEDFLHLIRCALLLIADCTWWLVTLLPRWLLYVVIAVGDFLVENITALRKAIVCTANIIKDDVFRLTIGIVILLCLWRNRRRLGIAIIRWILKINQCIRSCCTMTLNVRRISRYRINQNFMTPYLTPGRQKRSPLLRSSVSPINSDNTLDSAQRCVICKDRHKCILLLPCKHVCLCEECFNLLVSSLRKNCPLCRTFIDHSLSVYI